MAPYTENYDQCFINPYTFVPLNKEKKIIPQVTKGPLSGVIEYTLTPIGDIFIPDTSNDKAFNQSTIKKEHKSYDFFNLDNPYSPQATPKRVAIPGSAIKGALRTVYEALCDGCMSAIENIPLSKRSPTIKQPGLLIKNGSDYELYQAKRYMLNAPVKTTKGKRYIDVAGEKVYNFSKIAFSANQHNKVQNYTLIDNNQNNATKTGYLFLGEGSFNKVHDSIFENTNQQVHDAKNSVIPPQEIACALQMLKQTVTEYYSVKKINNLLKPLPQQTNALVTNNMHYGYLDFNLSANVIPVWYDVIDSKLQLSIACIGRDIFRTTQLDLIKGYEPCQDTNNICKCCNMYGFVAESNDDDAKAWTSKLEFSPIIFKAEPNDFQEITTLHELASPKITATEFYLEDPYEVDTYAVNYYDFEHCYYTDNDGNYCKGSYNAHRASGRKFYFHNTYATAPYKIANKDDNSHLTKRNITIRPLRGNHKKKLAGKIYYNNLTEPELKELLFTISLGANTNTNICHKIGHGKPIGLGTVKLTVNKVYAKELCLDDEEKTICYTPSKDITDKYSNVLCAMTDVCAENLSLKEKHKCIEEKITDLGFGWQTNNVFAILRIADTNTTNDSFVSYPLGQNNNSPKNFPYIFFTGNRQLDNNANPFCPIINNVLPRIVTTDEGDTLKLPKIRRT